MISRPTENEFAPFYLTYVSLVPETDILPVLEKQIPDLELIGRAVPSDRETFRYAPRKWSIREVFGHMIDAERVFAYRAFCISRGESAALPSFDENAYVASSLYNDQPLKALLAEFASTRTSNLAFLGRLAEQDWLRTGTASAKPVSVRALAFIMAGHVRHHINGLRTSYGVST
ncbi:MAG: DinB family protein [Bacteroidetes bacterium]|nr:DinB family protein [Bacteroidota bacterium]